MKPIDRVKEKFPNAKQSGEEHIDHCPAHEDKNPSFSFREGDDGKVLMNCKAGCSAESICSEVGLKLSDLMPSKNGNHKPPINGHSNSQNGHEKKDIAAIWKETEANPNASFADRWSKDLMVSAQSLEQLGAVPLVTRLLWPEFNFGGAVVGIGKRGTDGKKTMEPDSKRGVIVPHGLEDQQGTLFSPEGFSDTAALLTMGLRTIGRPQSQATRNTLPTLAKFAKQFDLVVVADNDKNGAGVEGAKQTAQKIATKIGKPIRWAKIPEPFKDARQYLAQQNIDLDDSDACEKAGQRLAEQLEASAVTVEPEDKNEEAKSDCGLVLTDASELDPATEAAAFLASRQVDGLSCLRYHRNCPQHWIDGRYVELDASEVQADLVLHINQHSRGLTTGTIGNIMAQVRAQSIIPSAVESPVWLGKPPVDWKPEEMLATKCGLVHLPSLTSSAEFKLPATPRYFSHTALDYDFDIDAPAPKRWLTFLQELWPDDPESIATLQEWFGYLLTSDTSQQKILVMVGPTRGGKGVTVRILTELLGKANIAAPTLASFETNFGLGPLLHASVGIIADARLSNRVDQSKIVERLLSISGEDPLTVDRKYREPVTGKIPARLMILSNELPRLAESSGALSARMIVLQLTQSWLGKEDPGLTAKLLPELPGILLWAVAGYQRLQSRGHFIQPESGRELVEDMADLSSPVGKFVRDRCEIAPGQQVSVDDVFEAWKEWCKENNREHAGTKLTFCRDLRAAVPNLKTVQHRETTRRVRYYEGLGLSGQR